MLFSPLKIREIELKNRLCVSLMCMYSSKDGFSNTWHLVHLGSRAVGGAGVIFTEAAAVSPEGRISPEDLGLWKEEHINGLKEIVEFIESREAVTGIQLAHAGRKASTYSPWNGRAVVPVEKGGWTPVAPSAVPFNEEDAAPQALEQYGIKKVITDFKAAAECVKSRIQNSRDPCCPRIPAPPVPFPFKQSQG